METSSRRSRLGLQKWSVSVLGTASERNCRHRVDPVIYLLKCTSASPVTKRSAPKRGLESGADFGYLQGGEKCSKRELLGGPKRRLRPLAPPVSAPPGRSCAGQGLSKGFCGTDVVSRNHLFHVSERFLYRCQGITLRTIARKFSTSVKGFVSFYPHSHETAHIRVAQEQKSVRCICY